MSQGFPPFPGDTPESSPGGFGGSGTGGFGGAPGGFGSPVGSGGFGGFGGPGADSGFSAPATGAATGSRRATSAPVGHLIPSLVLGLIGVMLNAWLSFSSTVATDTSFGIIAGVAWILSGLFGIICLGRYFTANAQRKATGFYSHIGWKKTLLYFTALVLLIAVVWSAIDIALWVGKL
ncbi:hypothetical protein [Corynebacterium sp. A21]|uniref:hypothetical protein n=1 Tax=Corynebacterium sp. A21 TaxID=3457318 RepID=UPI003FD23CB7